MEFDPSKQNADSPSQAETEERREERQARRKMGKATLLHIKTETMLKSIVDLHMFGESDQSVSNN